MKISVIIPTYNRAQLVLETIRNVQAQTLPPAEIIVVDDGSTDDSRQYLRALGSEIILVEQVNQGPGVARNAGFEISTGDFIHFMDSDDIISLNKLEVQYTALVAQNADMAFGPLLHMEWGNRQPTRLFSLLQTKHPGSKRTLLDWHLCGWALVLQNCLFRRTFLEKIGPLRTDLLGTEDWEYFNRIFLANPKAVFTPGCFTYYRTNGQEKLSGMGTSNKTKLKELAKAADCIQRNTTDCSVELTSQMRRRLRMLIWKIQQQSGDKLLCAPKGLREKIYFRAYCLCDRVCMKFKYIISGDPWKHYYHASKATSECLERLAETTITLPDSYDLKSERFSI